MRIGEIIETTSSGFVAESFELNRPPALGSLVLVRLPDETALYGAVTYGQTAGVDPSRRAVRRSTDVVFDGAIYKQHPELEHILRTEFGVALVGFVAAGRLRHHLPARPPPLHFSVQGVSREEVCYFTDGLLYFRLLLIPYGDVPPQQVLAANVRWVYEQRGHDDIWLDTAAREIATLLKNDSAALLTVLYAIDPGDVPMLREQGGVA